MRKVHTVSIGNRTVKVYRDVENNEFVCRLWEDGCGNPDADYHTDDKQDAIATAHHMAEGK